MVKRFFILVMLLLCGALVLHMPSVQAQTSPYTAPYAVSVAIPCVGTLCPPVPLCAGCALPIPCVICNTADCLATEAMIEAAHVVSVIGVDGAKALIPALPLDFIPDTAINPMNANRFALHRQFMMQDKFAPAVVEAMGRLATEMTGNIMAQAMIIGQFFDAKTQLESERLFGELKTEAFRDYKPSESFCAIGTNVRALAMSDVNRRFQNQALNQNALKRHLGVEGLAAADDGQSADMFARFIRYRENNCDYTDNGYKPTDKEPHMTGLFTVCPKIANYARANRDVNFTALIDAPRSLDVDLSDTNMSDDEQDVIALAQNLFGHVPISRNINFTDRNQMETYMDLRSVTARRSVAENSFNAIVAMKSNGSSAAGDSDQTYAYLAAVLSDLGIDKDDIPKMIGEKPSYYAQLEVLSKKMLQSPNFYTWLVDKPANVKRKEAALNGIELMLDRALYESELRSELIMSVLLATHLRDDVARESADLKN